MAVLNSLYNVWTEEDTTNRKLIIHTKDNYLLQLNNNCAMMFGHCNILRNAPVEAFDYSQVINSA